MRKETKNTVSFFPVFSWLFGMQYKTSVNTKIESWECELAKEHI